MLINLSNHPFKDWEVGHQKTAQVLYGQVEDIPFPGVDPKADTSSIVLLAAKYVKKCKIRFGGSLHTNDAVHISGEPCFLFHFIRLAKDQGIPCVCSTTQRLVTNNGNIKTSVFQFVQFRNY